MKQKLTILNYIDGIEDVPFFDKNTPIEITEYTYSSQRMGGVSLTATLMYRVCLDDYWDGKQYVLFNGERYFIKNIPSSSKTNEDARYKHSIEFVSERELKLGNIYFYDAVSPESSDDDKPKSNSSEVIFFGTIEEFAKRLGESLRYSGLSDYTVVVDEGVSSEAMQISFTDMTFFEVLQESYNIYEIPFYFKGKEIHFGFTSNAITQTFRYGVDNELLAVNKNNANYKIVTRCTGKGSSDNIPYYYPNNSEKGDIVAKIGDTNTGITSQDAVNIVNSELYADKVGLGKRIEYSYPENGNPIFYFSPMLGSDEIYSIGTPLNFDIWKSETLSFYCTFNVSEPGIIRVQPDSSISNAKINGEAVPEGGVKFETRQSFELIRSGATSNSGHIVGVKDGEFAEFEVSEAGEYKLNIKVGIKATGTSTYWTINADIRLNTKVLGAESWVYEGKAINLLDYGLVVSGEPAVGDYIVQEKERYVTPCQNLMPPIYRETAGAERFYNALNDTYTNPQTGEKYVFENEYNPQNPREHIVSFEDIKPTIKGITNAAGQEIGQFLDIAYDLDDNDETTTTDESTETYKHPYFFVKLPKFDGEWAFNLFDHAIDSGEMTLSMV